MNTLEFKEDNFGLGRVSDIFQNTQSVMDNWGFQDTGNTSILLALGINNIDSNLVNLLPIDPVDLAFTEDVIPKTTPTTVTASGTTITTVPVESNTGAVIPAGTIVTTTPVKTETGAVISAGTVVAEIPIVAEDIEPTTETKKDYGILPIVAISGLGIWLLFGKKSKNKK